MFRYRAFRRSRWSCMRKMQLGRGKQQGVILLAHKRMRERPATSREQTLALTISCDENREKSEHQCKIALRQSFGIINSVYSKSTTLAHLNRNSRSSGLPFTIWEAATIGSHFSTYCLAVSLFLQKSFR